MLQSILDNWAVFQELWDGVSEGEVDSEIRGQVIGVQTQMQSLIYFLEYNWEFFYSTIHTHHVIKLSKLQKYVFQHYKVRKRKLIEKDDHKLPKKEKFWVIMRKEKLL